MPELRFLKALVTGLALVMGLGIIALVALLWLRLGQPALPDLPAVMEMPAGARLEAVTFANDWIMVVTDQDEVLIFDRTGHLRDRMALPPSP